MIIVLIILSILFVGMGFMITPTNASSLLAGYNTMTKKEKAAFNLGGYLHFFKWFHISLGISLLILGFALKAIWGLAVVGVLLGIYPILAYGYFILRGQEFFRNQKRSRKKAYISVLILAITLVAVTWLSFTGIRENRLAYSSEKIEIEGIYGEIIPVKQIKRISLQENRPAIKLKTNGYSSGSVKKGYFQTMEGHQVKLILNTDQPPYILVSKLDGKNIYYSARSLENKVLFEEMKKVVPKELFK